jgi:hypothetical protein
MPARAPEFPTPRPGRRHADQGARLSWRHDDGGAPTYAVAGSGSPGVDNKMGESLYNPYHGAPPPRRDGAPVKLLNDHGSPTSGAGWEGELRRLSGFLESGAISLGCLKR